MQDIIETGSSEAAITVRIYATELVTIARALDGKQYIDLSLTDGVRRIANIERLDPDRLNPQTKQHLNKCDKYVEYIEQLRGTGVSPAVLVQSQALQDMSPWR